MKTYRRQGAATVAGERSGVGQNDARDGIALFAEVLGAEVVGEVVAELVPVDNAQLSGLEASMALNPCGGSTVDSHNRPLCGLRSWTLEHSGARPWTLNAERKISPFARSQLVAEWRQAFAWLARAQRIPRLEVVRIRAWPLVKNRRALQDVGGCVPAVKAGVDGLRDAHVLEDDGPDRLVELVLTGSVVGDRDGLVIVVEELVPSDR